jgi:hypothetical protein
MSFSADGTNYVYAIQMDGSHFQLIRDGVATSVMTLGAFTNVSGPPRVDFPQLMFSADGTRLVWVWAKSDGISGNTISIDGQEILHSHGIYEFPEFSPDSKHFATMVRASNKTALAVDGKTGPGYDDMLATNPNAARFLDAHTFRFLGVKNGSVYRVTVNLGG